MVVKVVSRCLLTVETAASRCSLVGGRSAGASLDRNALGCFASERPALVSREVGLVILSGVRGAHKSAKKILVLLQLSLTRDGLLSGLRKAVARRKPLVSHVVRDNVSREVITRSAVLGGQGYPAWGPRHCPFRICGHIKCA